MQGLIAIDRAISSYQLGHSDMHNKTTDYMTHIEVVSQPDYYIAHIYQTLIPNLLAFRQIWHCYFYW